jgi:hypothetical protein
VSGDGLADRLRREASLWPPSEPTEADLRAAADVVERWDRLRAALADAESELLWARLGADELLRMSRDCHPDELDQRVIAAYYHHMADAVRRLASLVAVVAPAEGPEATRPERCPTCGSDEPEDNALPVNTGDGLGVEDPWAEVECPDAFHAEGPEAAHG